MKNEDKNKDYDGFWRYFGITLGGIGCLVFIGIIIVIIRMMFIK